MGDILDNLVNQKPKILKGLLEQGFPQSRLETLVSEDYLAMEEGDETNGGVFLSNGVGWGVSTPYVLCLFTSMPLKIYPRFS